MIKLEEKETQNVETADIKEEIVEEVSEGNTKKENKRIFKKEDQEKLKLQEENKVLQDKVLRVTAEMQNMRRRMEEEKSALLKYEGEDLIKNLLPVVDNFERAISMDDINLEDEVSKFLSGFKMIYGNLSNVLQGYEVQTIDALNQAFDPNTMEAVIAEEVEGVEPNTVVDVLQKGYTYKGKVIRYAMVKVSK
ncbi:MAG: nucleotide exchange factor GrpE [Bacilli bacterium]|nr:nucleotide exchange factor GrpE [Bacilli bacterium]